MADNTRGGSTDGAAPLVASREVTYSGDTADVQAVGLVVLTGSDDAKTATDVTSAAPLPVSAVGDVAHDSTDTGNPLKIGGKAVDVVDSFPTDVGPGDRVDTLHGLKGQVFVAIMGQDGSANPNLTVLATPTPSLGATLANVSASVTSVTLQASNALRRGLTIWNDSTSVLYVKLGATASATSCTVKLVADDYYEVPFDYSGVVDGIWVSATGSARMTEVEP